MRLNRPCDASSNFSSETATSLFGKLNKKLSTRHRDDEVSDDDEEGSVENDRKSQRKKKGGRKKQSSDNKSGDETENDNDKVEGAEKGNASGNVSQFTIGKRTFNKPKFLSFSSDGSLFKLPRPQWYKNMMKSRTLPLGIGIRQVPKPVNASDGGDKPRPLPKNFAGSQPDDVISILITSMENLVDDPVIVHPVVRIHIVDITTGKYLTRLKRKNQKFESATTQFERQTILPTAMNKKRMPNKKCAFIPPVCTLPWRLSGVRGANPEWHEQVRRKKYDDASARHDTLRTTHDTRQLS